MPVGSTDNTIQKTVGDTVSVDMKVDPGSNSVSFILFQVRYDPTKLQISSTDPFTINTTSFPTKIEGPVVNNGTISESISVGSDPTKAIRTATKVGTLNFKTIATTDPGVPTVLSFTNVTQALSSGSNDQASENVLANVNPANITIVGVPGTPTPTDTPTATPTPIPPGDTTLSFTLLLHGIGAAGDNPNPSGNTLSNKNPQHPQRNLTVYIYNANDQLVTTKTGALNYDANTQTFHGIVSLGTTFTNGNYTVRVRTDRYLRRLIPGVQTIVNGQDNTPPQTYLVAGDVNGDNILNILDYSSLLDCGYGALNPLAFTYPTSLYHQAICQVHNPAVNVDIDDNNIINQFDYNLFLRELSVQNGD